MTERQIELEKEMLNLGVQRFNAIISSAREKGRESNTSYGARLIQEFTQPMAESIQGSLRGSTRGRTAKAITLLQDVDANVAALICMRTVMDGISQQIPATKLLLGIGTRIEDEIRFTKFKVEHEAYFETIMGDFRNKNTQSYRHMHAVLTKKANDMNDAWNSWSPDEKLHVGAFLTDCMIHTTDLIRKVTTTHGKKKLTIIEPTEAAEAWINLHINEMEILNPDYMPCVVPPMDWVAVNSGGYHTPELQRRLQFIKIKDGDHRKAIKGHNYDVHMHGVNIMQRTAWRVNTKVHDIIKEVWINNLGVGMPETEPYKIPVSPYVGCDPKTFTDEQNDTFRAWKREAATIYRLETERVAQLISLSRTLSLAKRYRDEEEFYYVYNCDFRGRVYCATSGMSPQGADFGKGLLQFATSVQLGATGGDHLAIHGANTYGEDKLSYTDRVKWVKENEFAIRLTATDPLCSESKSFWGNADKPFQFLAFCLEWEAYAVSGYSRAFLSSLPIAADGSCNGLQHFSALLKDTVGAQATNLLPGSRPEDIYQRVADVVSTKLLTMPDEYAVEWLNIGVGRKITKQPVMTLPYGSTLSSCTDAVEDWLYLNSTQHTWTGREINKAARFLSNVIWDSISEVVIAARAAMDWLRAASRVTSKNNHPLIWTSPSAFRVYQGTKKYETMDIATNLCGRTRLRLAASTDEIDPYKQANGASPNYVHSLDAAHMCMTLIKSNALGLNSFAMIHDDYGTHAGNMDVLHSAIREQFVLMYGGDNLLTRFVKENTQGKPYRFRPLPTLGTFNINEVLDSDYFFG